MSKVLSKELLDDIFAIPRDGSNINDEDDDGGGIVSEGKADVPFSEKATELSAGLAKTHPTPAPTLPSIPSAPRGELPNVGPIKVETKEVNVAKALETLVSAIPTIASPKLAFADSLPKVEVPIVPPKPSVPETPTISTVVATEADELVAVPVKVENIDFYKFPNGHCLWKFKSPSAQYQYFYAEKQMIVSKMLSGGEIPFEKYYKELRDINIDIGVDTYDTEEVNKRITEVMKWRDRVKFIQLHINSQYFGFKNFDDLLKGVLARIEYLRGKQEGLIYEHMSDYIGYVSELEGLYKSLEIVSKHLDAAYASLSRQAAIAQPFQEVDRYSNGVVSRPMTKELSRFDSLQKNANVSSPMTANKPKEAGKPAESSPKGWNLF